MDKDIERLINKACIKYCEQVDSIYNEKDIFSAGAEFGYNLCLSKWQEAERWRKVEEELPELKDDPYTINIRTIGKPISVSTWYIRDEYDIQILEKVKGCEWKPIS